MLLRAPSSRASYLYAALFGIQLLITLGWLSSIQREQHSGTGTGNSGGGIDQPFRPLERFRTPIPCTTNTGSTAQLSQAIQQLEQMKTSLHLGSSMPSESSIAERRHAATTTDVPKKKPFLIIGIPSMPRSADYLSLTLAAIDQQMERAIDDPMYNQIQVWIMNNARAEPGQSPVAHDSFVTNQARYKDRPEFRFLVNDHSLQDASPGSKDSGSSDHPGWKVRKQTRDIVRLMQEAKEQSVYYMAMEDDFELCPHTMRIIEHAIRKSSQPDPGQFKDWITLKFSYGFNGFMLKNNGDLQEFARYLLVHQGRRPPDHLTTEWSCAEKPEAAAFVGKRPHITYRYNLFTHLGKVSSLSAGMKADFPGCFHIMNTGVVFPVDAFDEEKCAHDDVTPCLPKDHPKWIPPYGIDPALVEKENKKK